MCSEDVREEIFIIIVGREARKEKEWRQGEKKERERKIEGEKEGER